nr:histone-lysine N-methyltransferase EZA1 [Tanacetum cinerariifolium]
GKIKAVDSNGHLRSCPSDLGGIVRGSSITRNGVGIILAGRHKDNVVRVGLSDADKKRFWDALDEMVRECLTNQRLIIQGDLNGHIGAAADGYTEGGGHNTQIDYLLVRRGDLKACKDCRAFLESWWFCEEVQTKVATKQSKFKDLLSCSESNQEDIDRAKERDLHMAFLDLEKAYDSVPCELVWKTLLNKGTPRIYSRVIKDIEKTEYIRCDFGRYEVVHQEMDIRIRDQILQPKESFRYLGSVLHRSGRIVDDMAHRIRAALAFRVEVAELRMLRWTCGKTMVDMISNEVFRAALEVDSIIDKMREGRLRWLEHVNRRPQSALVRRVEAMVVEGTRRRGRPKIRWEDRLKMDMKELRLSEDMISDRNA